MTAHELVRMGQFLNALNRIEREHRVHLDRADPIHVYPSRDQWADLEVAGFFDDGIEIKRKGREHA